MSTGALENKPQEKSGRAIALPAPPPSRSLLYAHYWRKFPTTSPACFQRKEPLELCDTK